MDIVSLLRKKRCILLGHSLGVESSSLATIIAQKCSTPEFKTCVVSWNKHALNSGVEHKITALDYGESKAIETMTKTFIIFDNAEHAVVFFGPSILYKVLLGSNSIVLLFNVLTPPTTLKEINTMYPLTFVAMSTFADQGQDIRFHHHKSRMTEYQDSVYAIKRAEELKEPDRVKERLLRSLQYENIVYPAEIEQMLKDDGDTIKIADVIERYREDILINSPKIVDLISVVVLNRKDNHLIFTRYLHHYGVEFLEAVFKVYEITPYVIHSGMTTTQREAVINNFNTHHEMSSEAKLGAVLISNIVFSGLKVRNIHHIHMLDGGYKNAPLLLDLCYKYYNYPPSPKGVPPQINIHYYTTSRYDGYDSASNSIYDKEITKWTELFNGWSEIYTKTASLVLSPKGILSVVN